MSNLILVVLGIGFLIGGFFVTAKSQDPGVWWRSLFASFFFFGLYILNNI